MSIAHDPTTPRLFADYAAAPTKRERKGTRQYWQRAQSAFDLLAELEPEYHAPCPVCAGDHTPDRCPHGDAVELF